MSGPISHHGPSDGEAPASDEGATADQKAQMEQAYAQMRRKLRMTRLAEDIEHKVMVLSGKGGVGKSTVATGLALSLARQGKKVGILDIDITGPNIPKMLGIEDTELHVEDSQIHPADGHSELNQADRKYDSPIGSNESHRLLPPAPGGEHQIRRPAGEVGDPRG